MDQDNDGFSKETQSRPDPDGDAFAIPQPISGLPFQLPYNTDTLPLIIPGRTSSLRTFTATGAEVNKPVPPVGNGGTGVPSEMTTTSTINVSGYDADQTVGTST
jgi:hypothetical protein